MTQFYSTRQAARVLKTKADTLQKNIWLNRVSAPQKGPSGQYLWTIEDIERAAWALHCYDDFAEWRATIKPEKRQPTVLGAAR